MEIELVGLDPDDVAGRSGRQHVLRKRLAKSRDVDPQRGGGALGRVLAPELVDQPVSGNDLVGVEEEHGEKRTRLAPAQGNLAAFVPHLERSQDPELHLSGLPARDATSCCASETDLKRRSISDSTDELKEMRKGDGKMSTKRIKHVIAGAGLVAALVALAVVLQSGAAPGPDAAKADPVKQRVAFTTQAAGSTHVSVRAYPARGRSSQAGLGHADRRLAPPPAS